MLIIFFFFFASLFVCLCLYVCVCLLHINYKLVRICWLLVILFIFPYLFHTENFKRHALAYCWLCHQTHIWVIYFCAKELEKFVWQCFFILVFSNSKRLMGNFSRGCFLRERIVVSIRNPTFLGQNFLRQPKTSNSNQG